MYGLKSASLTALLAAAVFLAGCQQVSVKHTGYYESLHGKTLLYLEADLEPPFPEKMHAELQTRIRASIQKSPHLKKVMLADSLKNSSDPAALGYSQLFSLTVNDTGIIDPEMAIRLGNVSGAALIATAQLYYIPCKVCENGDELWLVGQIISAVEGELLFRMHIKNPVGVNPDDLEEEATDMVVQYLERLELTMEPKWHRLRFGRLSGAPPS